MIISFELSDKDIRYFRQVLQRVRKGRKAAKEEVVIRESKALLTEVQDAEAPVFVRSRIGQLDKLIAMLEDADW